MANSKAGLPGSSEIWFVECPHCMAGNYAEFAPPPEPPDETRRWEWQILKCRCNYRFSLREARDHKPGLTTRITDPDRMTTKAVKRMVKVGIILYDDQGFHARRGDVSYWMAPLFPDVRIDDG